MAIVAYFWLKSEIYSKKVPIMTNNTHMRVTGFINIYDFSDIKYIILHHLRLTQKICTNMHLRKVADSICCSYSK